MAMSIREGSPWTPLFMHYFLNAAILISPREKVRGRGWRWGEVSNLWQAFLISLLSFR